MTYSEMQKAEAEYLKATETPKQKKPRGATKAQLAYRAWFARPPCTCEDGFCDRHIGIRKDA